MRKQLTEEQKETAKVRFRSALLAYDRACVAYDRAEAGWKSGKKGSQERWFRADQRMATARTKLFRVFARQLD